MLIVNLCSIKHDYMGEKDVVELVFMGKGQTIFDNYISLKMTGAEAADFKVGETFELRRTA
jgi:hypothetical protein